jgi:hypothetical protein
MTTAEQMALEVLRGDLVAAKALADLLLENVAHGEIPVLRVKTITVSDPSRLKVLLYYSDTGYELTEDRILRFEGCIKDWLRVGGPTVLTLMGVDRMEIYELPKSERALSSDGESEYELEDKGYRGTTEGDFREYE